MEFILSAGGKAHDFLARPRQIGLPSCLSSIAVAFRNIGFSSSAVDGNRAIASMVYHISSASGPDGAFEGDQIGKVLCNRRKNSPTHTHLRVCTHVFTQILAHSKSNHTCVTAAWRDPLMLGKLTSSSLHTFRIYFNKCNENPSFTKCTFEPNFRWHVSSFHLLQGANNAYHKSNSFPNVLKQPLAGRKSHIFPLHCQ